MTETEVLCIDLPNDPVVLADVATVLGQNHININYAYCTSGGREEERRACSRRAITLRRSTSCPSFQELTTNLTKNPIFIARTGESRRK